jgi:hypothetical protein
MDWFDLLQNDATWRTLVNAVMSRRFPQNAGISLLAEQLFAFQEGLCSVLWLFCAPLN